MITKIKLRHVAVAVKYTIKQEHKILMQKILENCAGYVMKRYATYRDKICVYDKHLIAGQDMQCQAPYSQSNILNEV